MHRINCALCKHIYTRTWDVLLTVILNAIETQISFKTRPMVFQPDPICMYWTTEMETVKVLYSLNTFKEFSKQLHSYHSLVPS